ncbi:hypothetical protein WAE61_01870 [Comamonadaceae bacterium PP-2]
MTTTEQGAQPAPQGVPDGWKLVPLAPTPEMMTAAFDAYTARLDGTAVKIINAHKAMLAAAPAAPQAEPQPLDKDYWPCDPSMSRRQLVHRIGQMNFRLTALREENAGLIKHNGRLRKAQATPMQQPAGEHPALFGYVNTQTGQFFTDVEQSRKNNEGHWRTVYVDADRAARAAPTQVDAGAIDDLIDRLLDAQQDLNLAANEAMSQPLASAAALLDDVEIALRRYAALAAQGGQDAEPVAKIGMNRYGGKKTEWFDAQEAAEMPVGTLIYARPPRTQGDAGSLREPANGSGWKVHWWNESMRLMLPDGLHIDSYQGYRNGAMQFTIKADAAIARQGEKGGA